MNNKIKIRRSFQPYLFYSVYIFVFGRQIPNAEGVLLLFSIISTGVLVIGLLCIIIYPSMIVIESDTIHVHKNFFRYSKFNLKEIKHIDTSGPSFLHAKLVFHDERKPLRLSLWDTSEKSFKKLGSVLEVSVS